MEAIILAGGHGTRLQSVVKDLPKPMAPVNGRPFLAYVMSNLRRHGISRFIMSVGYKHKAIQDYFGDSYKSMPITYVVEKTPLGTGGGIKAALDRARHSPVLVTNGDTFFDVAIDQLLQSHNNSKADVTLGAKYMDDLGRYGSVVFDDAGTVVDFQEKSSNKAGYINGGVYLMNRTVFEPFLLRPPFSFETDYMEAHLEDILIRAVPSNGYFIDIGIPGDYGKAPEGLAGFDE